ncbi:hypothetical protein RND71_002861 [Anisodus tanguticus]|uniref:Uncharacterized protein n=1 Tax=Anisodus tanguticus TaxID=243964 RepID=A0AAE1SVL5_9SOLA|nr:hypothetical protein RND71_002861 [Anisodus tanguticus]
MMFEHSICFGVAVGRGTIFLYPHMGMAGSCPVLVMSSILLRLVDMCLVVSCHMWPCRPWYEYVYMKIEFLIKIFYNVFWLSHYLIIIRCWMYN